MNLAGLQHDQGYLALRLALALVVCVDRYPSAYITPEPFVFLPFGHSCHDIMQVTVDEYFGIWVLAQIGYPGGIRGLATI
jgi:hypothetical protein